MTAAAARRMGGRRWGPPLLPPSSATTTPDVVYGRRTRAPRACCVPARPFVVRPVLPPSVWRGMQRLLEGQPIRGAGAATA